MDTSEIYIKMCEKAEEVQELKHKGLQHHIYLEKGDYTIWHNLHSTPIICSQGYDLMLGIADKIFWLPRQDQLQEIVLPTLKYQDTEHLLRAFNEWDFSEKGYEPYSRLLTSMEQLWLAFVMKEKYNKIWNGEEWITS
jgi:hypothetical protein